MPSVDTTDSIYLHTIANHPVFQQRCWLRYLIFAFSVANEASVATASAVTAAGSAVLTFVATPASITGLVASDLTTVITTTPPFPINPIPFGAKVLSVTATTATLDHNIVGDGVAIGDVISFAPVYHEQKRRFAAALFSHNVDLTVLADAILADSTNRTNCLADRVNPGGNITDAGIDAQVAATFTGLSIVRNW